MAVKLPLVVANGQIEQLQAGDSIDTGLPAIQHVFSTNATIPAGYSLYVSRYVEIAAGVTLEIGADADLEIG